MQNSRWNVNEFRETRDKFKQDIRSKLQLQLFGNGGISNEITELQNKNDFNCLTKEEEEQGIKLINGNFDQYYELIEKIGEGSVGLVWKARNLKNQKLFAVKQAKTCDVEAISNIKYEFSHMKKLRHPNIISTYELYIDPTNFQIFIVMELFVGREMFEVLEMYGGYTEEQARYLFLQILRGVKYLHENGICHRDIKPNNILSDEEGKRVKITDFNVAKFSDNYKQVYPLKKKFNMKMWTYTGTLSFSAPEILKSMEYTEAVDIWSLGCLLYTMLSGSQPFNQEFVQDLIDHITSCKYEMVENILPWNEISNNAKQLVKRCLRLNYNERISIDDAIIHPFIIEKVQKTTESNQLLSKFLHTKLKMQSNRFIKNRMTQSHQTQNQQTLQLPFETYIFGNKTVYVIPSVLDSIINQFSDMKKSTKLSSKGRDSLYNKLSPQIVINKVEQLKNEQVKMEENFGKQEQSTMLQFAPEIGDTADSAFDNTLLEQLNIDNQEENNLNNNNVLYQKKATFSKFASFMPQKTMKSKILHGQELFTIDQSQSNQEGEIAAEDDDEECFVEEGDDHLEEKNVNLGTLNNYQLKDMSIKKMN